MSLLESVLSLGKGRVQLAAHALNHAVIAIEMLAAIRPYSMAVAPDSSRRNLRPLVTLGSLAIAGCRMAPPHAGPYLMVSINFSGMSRQRLRTAAAKCRQRMWGFS